MDSISKDEFENAQIKKQIDIHKSLLKKKNFENITFLGKGGYGYVYSVQEKNKRSPFAIKMIQNSSNVPNSKGKSIAQNEIDVLLQLRGSPYVIQLLDYFTYDDYTFICMNECKQTLSQLMKKQKLSESMIIKFSMDILEGLSFIHKKNDKLLFTDMKPDNILIDYSGEAVLADVGLAKELQSDASHSVNPVGNILYISPESFNNQIRFESCLYSLGMIMIVMIKGEEYINKEFTVQNKLQGNVVFKDFPQEYEYKNELEHVINGLLNKDFKKRIDLNIAKFILKGIACEINEKNAPNFEESKITQMETSKISDLSDLSDLNLTKDGSTEDLQNELNLDATEIKEDEEVAKQIINAKLEDKGFKQKLLARANYYLQMLNLKQKSGNDNDVIDTLIDKKKHHFLIRIKDKNDIQNYKIYRTIKNQNTSTIISDDLKFLKALQLYNFIKKIRLAFKK